MCRKTFEGIAVLRAVLFLAVLAAGMAGCAGPTARVEVTPDIVSFKVKTVAILPFEGAPVDQEVKQMPAWAMISYPNNGDTVSDLLATEMIGVGGFHYLERSQIRKVLEEKGFSASELFRQKSASEIGKLVGADAVLVGSVSRLCHYNSIIGVSIELGFSARLVHTDTGVVLWAASVTRKQDGTSDVLGAVRVECRSIADKIRERLATKPVGP